MKFVSAVCPSCGGDLQLPPNRKQVQCMYCGNTVIVREAVELAGQANAENYLALADAAAAAGNHEEAYGYYTKILEIDPSNADAWFGKATAAGWLSNVINIRTGEMIAGLNNAIENTPEDQQTSVKQKAVVALLRVIDAVHAISHDWLVQYIGLPEWQNYLNRCATLVSALEAAQNWEPSNPDVLKRLIVIYDSQIAGYSYVDFNGLPAAVWLQPEWAKAFRAKRAEYVARLRRLDPTFKAPEIARPTTRGGCLGCFIATAAMGSADHPAVETLRQFRDYVLMRHTVGRTFIRFYNSISPKLAARIEHNAALRALTRFMVVLPASALARAVICGCRSWSIRPRR
jgi:tetratricopeptide (TPR) repeat protein